MAKATGDIVETPTQQMPYKAIIKLDGQIVSEEFFQTRAAAEAFIVDAVKRPEALAHKGGKLR